MSPAQSVSTSSTLRRLGGWGAPSSLRPMPCACRRPCRWMGTAAGSDSRWVRVGLRLFLRVTCSSTRRPFFNASTKETVSVAPGAQTRAVAVPTLPHRGRRVWPYVVRSVELGEFSHRACTSPVAPPLLFWIWRLASWPAGPLALVPCSACVDRLLRISLGFPCMEFVLGSAGGLLRTLLCSAPSAAWSAAWTSVFGFCAGGCRGTLAPIHRSPHPWACVLLRRCSSRAGASSCCCTPGTAIRVDDLSSATSTDPDRVVRSGPPFAACGASFRPFVARHQRQRPAAERLPKAQRAHAPKTEKTLAVSHT